ncbi:MAG: polyprenyl synthetase family protein [Bacteroidetes bacterium]|nr:polyprenyl synthetase family protein [Bacteroidota bacterium]
MQSFAQLVAQFNQHFERNHFPSFPSSLYDPNRHFLQIGGKRIRPVLCLMGNELFSSIHPSTWDAATAIELFHNFTLIHDDIMDKAPLRRGVQTVHEKYGNNTALLAGDVMMINAYTYLNKVPASSLHAILTLFNKTAIEICEGQQLDMDFENQLDVSLEAYLQMIEKKTSVLLAAALMIGAILGGASERNQQLLYSFGLKLGLAFQVQDDYLDAFGDPAVFGKLVGGDILADKKTFLLIHALNTADSSARERLLYWQKRQDKDKVAEVISIYKHCQVDAWALQLKQRFLDEAMADLDQIAVVSSRKQSLQSLADYLIQRQI